MLWFKKSKHDDDEEAVSGGVDNTLTVRSKVYEEPPVLGPDLDVEDRIPESAGNVKWHTREWNNRVKTSQYTWWSLVPVNLFQQATVPANFYFIIMSIMQLIPIISDSNGVPTYLVPLAFVMAVTMIKDGWEDVKRHRQDRDQNTKDTKVLSARGEWLDTKWENIRVGDIVRVEADQIFPADLVLLTCSDDYGIAYVNTVQLDGETNMKTKTSIPSLHETYGRHIKDMAQSKSKLYSFNGVLRVKDHDYDFSGDNIKLKASLSKRRSIFGSRDESQSQSVPSLPDGVAPSAGSVILRATSDRRTPLDGEEFAVSLNQFLWRGATLVNTSWAAGLVVYTGHNTRIYKNTRERTAKTSGLLKSYNIDAVILFLAEVILCLIAAALYTWDISKVQSQSWYLQPSTVRELNGTIEGGFIAFAVAFGRYALLLSYFIPITLFVQVEISRWFESFFIRLDERATSTMCSATNPVYPSVSTMGVLEDLGNVTHIFSDKTGTLTQNLMQLRACQIGQLVFDHRQTNDMVATPFDRTEIAYGEKLRAIAEPTPSGEPPNVDLNPNPFVYFDASRIRKTVLSNPQEIESVRAFFLILSLCHSVLPKVESVITPTETASETPCSIVNVISSDNDQNDNGSAPLANPHEMNSSRIGSNHLHLPGPSNVGAPKPSEGEISDDSMESEKGSDSEGPKQPHQTARYHQISPRASPTPQTSSAADTHSHVKGPEFDNQSYHGASANITPDRQLTSFVTARDNMTQSDGDEAFIPIEEGEQRSPFDAAELPIFRHESETLISPRRPQLSADSLYPPVERAPLRLRDLRSVRVGRTVVSREETHCADVPARTDEFVEISMIPWNRSLATPYDASSPDELALVSAAKHLGIEFIRRPDLNSIQIAILNANTEKIVLTEEDQAWVNAHRKDAFVPGLTFGIHEVLDFDNFRKRMSVIITDRDGTTKILTKGADSALLKAAAGGQEQMVAQITATLQDFAKEGLRTLVLGYRVIEADELISFKRKLADLRATGNDDTETYAALFETVERDLTLVGCTAIDDRLQDEVPETIEALKDAGVRLWVLTGDKVETAISIGYSCNLLCEDTYNAIIDGDSKAKVQQQMYEYMAFVVAGQLAKESFDRILTQLETDSPLETTETGGIDIANGPKSCMQSCLQVTCCRGRRGAGRRKRETSSRKRKVNETMNVEDFIKVVSFNARHTKVVAPVDGRSEPKALSAEEVERLIQLYIGAFEPHEEKGPLGILGDIIVPKRTQTSPQAARLPKATEEAAAATAVAAQQQVSGADGNITAVKAAPVIAPGDVERFKSVAITVTGDALTHCLSDSETKRYFFGLAHLCSTVIACRVTPKQKAEIVRQCARITPAENFTSLAIGDGANDVGMILTADIGIGICGKEGSQAACSADIAIGEFKILRNMLFVHGHQILRRHSTMVYQTIFKNVLFAVCCFICGFFCGFSAADPYDSYMKQLFNLLYTPWCIMSAAVFDRHLPYDLLTRCGSLYPINFHPNGDMYYGFKRFCSWFFYALLSGVVICMVPWGALNWSASLVQGGKEYVDWNTYGQIIFILVVLVAVMCTVPYTCTVYWFTILAWVLSIGSIYLSWLVLAQIPSERLFKSWSGQWGAYSSSGSYQSSIMFHLVIFCALLIPIGALFCHWRYNVFFKPSPNVVVRERLKKGVFDVVVAPSRRGEYQTVVVPRTQTQIWKGFAYTPSDTRFGLQRRSMSSIGGIGNGAKRGPDDMKKLTSVKEVDSSYGSLFD